MPFTVITVIAALAGAAWIFRDQLPGTDAATASGDQNPSRGSGPARSGPSAEPAATAPVAVLEADIRQHIDALTEATVQSVDCFGFTQVAVDDVVDCTVQTGDAAVDITVAVTRAEPIGFSSTLDPADFRSAEPTPREERASARAALNGLRADDVLLLPLDGQWGAQLSSKAEGITDPLQVADNGTHTFYSPDILAEHESLRFDPRFEGDVLLVKGTDFGEMSTYNGKPFWITLVLGDFSSSDDVDRWCEAQFPDLDAEQLANACLPRTLDPPN